MHPTPSADTLVPVRRVRFLRDGRLGLERHPDESTDLQSHFFQQNGHRSCHGDSQFLKEPGRITQLPEQLECG